MKWRKILAAGMGLVMAAGLMSGCGGQTKEADNNKKDGKYSGEEDFWSEYNGCYCRCSDPGSDGVRRFL